ncbi:zinc ABC transporter ATP-binding protein ZnuC [Lutibaculum baratangense]|uniref:Zinc ABC transporter, ATP-binding protein ZnuC n=1 Tax=Lutibaculum baratangense AMV1 TaxID=631454 RepID=V4T7I6_9HYPH|nr:Zinc ABC transporter, ATP-binding protein ZnuC [Lutibaculum baratangense AMV1]
MLPTNQTQPARAAGPLVRASGLGVERGGRFIVRDIDLTVSEGEVVTLLGPNGGGKTTTLRAILQIVKPTLGTVERRPGLRVGYVPQRLAIDWTLPLSVKRLMTLTGSQPRERIEAALAETGVAHLVDRPVQALSGGEFQRVLIARAILNRPQLLVLDEPVQGVDFAGEIALYELIGTIRDKLGCGILLVSHDLHLVMARTDRVICINTHVCCAGAPRDVARDPAYTALFGPRAAEVVAVYRHEHDHVHDEAHGPLHDHGGH